MDESEQLPKVFQEEDDIGFPTVPSRNVLIHGPGGTGKTYLLRNLLKRYSHLKIVATSLTGISAIGLNIPEDLIYASTVHRWAGIGLGEADKDKPTFANKSNSVGNFTHIMYHCRDYWA